MNRRLVLTCIRILRLLLDGSAGVNRIIEQTSGDRSYVIDVLNKLERGQLLKTIKSHERKDKKIKELTPLGQEVAELIRGIEQIENSYLELIKNMTENFGIFEGRTPPSVVRSKLQVKNWKDGEISSYRKWAEEARLFGLRSSHAFIIAIFFRYTFLLFKMGTNELACNILSTIFSNAMNNHFSNGLIAFINAIKLTYDVSKNEQEISRVC
jgi:DNA-binding PadR family transcriptional regulator